MRIAIVGCGWVGVRLAAYLKEKNHHVIATTTSAHKLAELQSVASEACIFNINQPVIIDALASVDAVIFSMPVAKNNWLAGFMELKLPASQTLFFSSTGIYPQQDGVFTEEYCDNLRGDIERSEETVLQKYPQTTILRLGGIMGDNRSVHHFFGHKSVPNPSRRVNHIHYEDILQVVELILNTKDAAGTYNIVAPEHPTIGEILNIQPDSHTEPGGDANERIISSQKLINDYNYIFKHPNPKYF